MTLEFTKQGDIYVAEFTADAPFSLHVERDSVGYIEMLQNSVTGGKYDTVREFKVNAGDPVFDFDSGDFLGTKFIRIESEVLPTFAAVTTSGEVTEIKSQSKEVEVTSNGTMDITPDAGFSYLNSVKVKTNVPTSGGGSASSVEYFDVRGMNDDNKSVLIMYALQLKLTGENVVLGTQITSHGIYSRAPMPSAVTAISIDVTMPMTKYMSNGQSDKQELTTLEEMGISAFTDNLPRLTKEEFYNIA